MTLRHKQAFLVIFFSHFTYRPSPSGPPPYIQTWYDDKIILPICCEGREAMYIGNAQGGTHDRSV